MNGYINKSANNSVDRSGKSAGKQAVHLEDNRLKPLIQQKSASGVFQLVEEDERLVNKGMLKLTPYKSIFKPFISDKLLENFAFILGMAEGNSIRNSIVAPLSRIVAHASYKKNQSIITNLSHEIGKCLTMDEEYNSVLKGGHRAEFIQGRTSELEGLAGELKVFDQLVTSGSSVSAIGDKVPFGKKQKQEVDITATIGGQKYFIEVAATPDKLRSKINEGKSGNTQLANYLALSDDKKIPVAYACPTIKIENISLELISKIRAAKIMLLINGAIYSADKLLAAVEKKGDTAGTTSPHREKNKYVPRKASASDPGKLTREYHRGEYDAYDEENYSDEDEYDEEDDNYYDDNYDEHEEEDPENGDNQHGQHHDLEERKHNDDD